MSIRKDIFIFLKEMILFQIRETKHGIQLIVKIVEKNYHIEDNILCLNQTIIKPYFEIKKTA